MITLTDRLQKIADEISRGETVADIGTDHGFLPIYLWENQICPKVIMADVSKGSLDKARCNCQTMYPDVSFDLRLGNGLEVLSEGEVDTVVIAGMGGILMTQIMASDMAKTRSIKKYVLQPRISAGKLRHWLIANDFCITGDRLVRENRFICNVLTAVTDGRQNIKELQDDLSFFSSLAEDDIQLEMPIWLMHDPLGRELVQRRIDSEKSILSQLELSRDDNKKNTVKQNIKYLEELLNR